MLTSEQRTELDALMRKRHGNAALARRARCVMLSADGERRVDIDPACLQRKRLPPHPDSRIEELLPH